MEEMLLKIVTKINEYLSNYMLLFLLIGIGLFYTIRTRFVQVRCFGEGFKKVFGKFTLRGGKQEGGLSSFQALATAIAAQVGTGNIVGASGAILVGGPGAIFWMWIIAFFGMATIYAEAVLAQETRVVDQDGSVHGGPVYYIRKAFTGGFGKFLAGFFAVAAILALGFMGSMVQSNSIAGTMNTAFGIDGWVIGLIVAAIAAFIFLGGIQRIASVTEKIVPIMALLFIVGCLVILGIRYQYILPTFKMIFVSAFDADAVIGGGIGAIIVAVTQGAKRGLFSNEAGMGSTPHAHAMAKVKKPHDQGVAAMVGVFIDTFIVLTLTALVVISTMYMKDGEFVKFFGENFADRIALTVGEGGLEIDKNNLMQAGFSSVAGESFGSVFVAVCLLFFAFSTIISWNFFGKINVEYLFGKKAAIVYSVIAVGFIFMGSVLQNDLVWELTDMFNNLMVLPNVIALACLSGIVAKAANKQNKLKK
ncbi:MAG: alanine:cation symporter family protein [Clostridia bacterium]|nr:alanine:cation symporter family protein [Clostridia bacterium]